MAEIPPPRAALYARISRAETSVDKVKNQFAELRKLAKQNGYAIVAEYQDDDISAFRGKAERPGYLALLAAIGEKKFDVVMATEPQRFTRGSQAQLEALTYQCARSGAVLHTRSAGVQDPATPTTLALMQIMDVIGGLEVATKIERQKARNRADVEAGIPTKGLRPFGWEPDRVTIRESEAFVIRQAFDMILHKGATLWAIAQHWNAIGVQTDGMGRFRLSRATGLKQLPSRVWTTTGVRQILVRPRNAGILMHEGVVMPNSKIQAIVSGDELEALLSAIRGSTIARGPKPQYLLGGLMECPCGERMHASKSVTAREGKPSRSYQIYRCRVYGFDKSQSHVNIQLDIADKAVRDRVVEDIGLELLGTVEVESPRISLIQSELGSLREAEEETTTFLVDKVGSKQVLLRRLREIDARRTALNLELESVLATSSQSTALEQFRFQMSTLTKFAPDIEINALFERGFEAWDALPMDSKRSIIRGNYRVQVQSRGRGIERVIINRK